jgi:signal transduction histidine kinase
VDRLVATALHRDTVPHKFARSIGGSTWDRLWCGTLTCVQRVLKSVTIKGSTAVLAPAVFPAATWEALTKFPTSGPFLLSVQRALETSGTWSLPCISAGGGSLVVLIFLGLGAGRFLRRARTRAMETGRTTERERIARDLHDTLIQSINGLILEVQSYAGELTPQSILRLRFEAALDRASVLLDEARDRVSNLRDQTPRRDLPSALRDLVNSIDRAGAPHVDIEVRGSTRALRERAAADLYDIAREAMTNACAHARASRIKLVVAYSCNHLMLSISDDGIGVAHASDQSVLSRAGHFGIQGMRERAERVRASLTIRNCYPSGTEVSVKALAVVVYEDTYGPCVSNGARAFAAKLSVEVRDRLRCRATALIPFIARRTFSSREHGSGFHPS